MPSVRSSKAISGGSTKTWFDVYFLEDMTHAVACALDIILVHARVMLPNTVSHQLSMVLPLTQRDNNCRVVESRDLFVFSESLDLCSGKNRLTVRKRTVGLQAQRSNRAQAVWYDERDREPLRVF